MTTSSIVVTYDRPAFTDLIVNNVKSPIDPTNVQVIFEYITTPSNTVSLFGKSVPNIKLDLLHITGYTPNSFLPEPLPGILDQTCYILRSFGNFCF